MSIKRTVLCLLTAAMLAAPLTACENGQSLSEATNSAPGTAATTVVTDDPKKDEAPRPASFTPDEIRKKLNSSSYRITSKIDTVSDGTPMELNYLVERQSSRYRMLLEMDMGDLGSIEQDMYFNLDNHRVYAEVDGEWYYYVDETVASEEMIFSEIFLTISPDVLFSSDSYDYDAQNQRYAMKQDVLAEQTGYEGTDAKKVSLYLSEADDVYLIAIRDGTDGTEATVRIAFASVTVKLPGATELPDEGGDVGGDIGGGEEGYVESPYVMGELLDLLADRDQVWVDPYSAETWGITVWQGEGVENLFDGLTTKFGGDRTANNDTYIYFSLEEPAQISTYVLTTANDTARFPERNPVEWELLGTNDPFMEDWVVLDYVWDGNLYSENFVEHGYLIDADKQGEYQHYALRLGYCSGTQFQLSELRLYTGGHNMGGGFNGEKEPGNGVYTNGDLIGLVSDKQSLTDLGMIDQFTLHSLNFTPWNEDEGVDRLFDGIDTFDEWYYNADGSLKEEALPDLMEGGGPGKCSGMVYDGRAYFFFATEVEVEVEAYVLTTANDNAKFLRNPYSFALYGTNDRDAFYASAMDYSRWKLLDSPISGCMEDQNFTPYGFLVDHPGKYRYYCLAIEYVRGTQFQLGEVELYIGK
ncbi:MAG: hypothetical protein IJX47_08085 [Clostridia bacterium]|nr:hypothetical protein [Clostridia bacterium]